MTTELEQERAAAGQTAKSWSRDVTVLISALSRLQAALDAALVRTDARNLPEYLCDYTWSDDLDKPYEVGEQASAFHRAAEFYMMLCRNGPLSQGDVELFHMVHVEQVKHLFATKCGRVDLYDYSKLRPLRSRLRALINRVQGWRELQNEIPDPPSGSQTLKSEAAAAADPHPTNHGSSKLRQGPHGLIYDAENGWLRRSGEKHKHVKKQLKGRVKELFDAIIRAPSHRLARNNCLAEGSTKSRSEAKRELNQYLGCFGLHIPDGRSAKEFCIEESPGS